MSKAVIVIDQSEVSGKALMAIKPLTGASLADLKLAIGGGLPILSEKLFYNNHDDVSQKLKSLLSVLHTESVSYSIYELDEESEFKNEADHSVDKIDEETLLNILNSHRSRS